MILSKRSYVTFILLCAGVAGCTPANFIQRARTAPPCNVQICTNMGAGPARCECQTHEQVRRQVREAFGQQID
jgi:hypothetical protein